MEVAVGAASWLVGKVVTQLSDSLVEAYVASTELGLNMEQIKSDLMFTQGLLHEAQMRRDVSNPGLPGLLEILSKKADEAEDTLDELQYFIIQDQIHGTHEATPVVDSSIRGQALHGHHVLHRTVGNCLSCFSSSSTRDGAGDHVGKLTFNRVDMSKKIKSIIEGIHAACNHVSNLLKIIHPTVGRVLKRPPSSSTITQNELYGREDIFNQTLDDMCTIRTETLSVLPIVGPGGIGKTTFAQHLYNHKKTVAHFSKNKAWLQKSIEERLDPKRFLLVLDDMWKCNSEAEWGSLLAPFKTGEAKGSVVIVTTRFPSIAQMMKTTKPIELQGLEDDEFLTFFEECIFGQDKPACYEDDFIDIARKISKKLKGFPLAAKSVGRLLKNNLSQESWMEVLERNEWKNRQDSLESFPHNFSKLIHLRYLKLKIPYNVKLSLPNAMKYLRRLEEYHVKKEGIGFELSELGDLTELGGELKIFNLENVTTREEANEAKLMIKTNLKTLKLVWSVVQRTTRSDVLDGLQPPPNLKTLVIINHGGSVGPSWLCSYICVKYLKSLHLEGVCWGTLPLFGQLMQLEELTLKSIAGIHQLGPDFGGVTQKSFSHLKKVELINMPDLVEWVGGAHCHLFSKITSIKCENCPNFSSLLRPSSECSVSHIQDINTTWFPNLCDLDIRSCPKLSLPPMPHTSTLTRVSVRKGDETLLYFREEELTAYHYDGALALHNLGKVKAMEIVDMLHFPLADLQNLNCLTRHSFEDCDNIDNTVVLHSVQSLYLDDCHLTGKSLTMVLSIFPALTYFNLRMFGENHDIEEIVLQAPITCSLCHMSISSSKNLVLPVEDGGGLQELSSLQSLRISDCGRMFSRWCMVDAGARTSKPLPSSLRELSISRESSMQSMALLSNLTSLTHLTLLECEDLTVDGFDPLITLNLKELVVLNNCYENNYTCSIAADLLSEMTRTKVLSAGSLQLEALKVDNISGVLVPSICSLLAANLHKLIFKSDLQMESFDEEQEQALQLLTSLKQLYFADCLSLLSLPDGLHRISSLQKLHIYNCPKIGFLPKEGFPSSLRDLVLSECSVDLQDQLKKLETSNPDLFVHHMR
uniref:Uncharacterized protein n=1 Tax=Oryza barthii TaxID=65489 RepID=A0A0D3F3B4_9ORYZ